MKIWQSAVGLLLLYLSLPIPLESQTAIVAIMTPDSILIAADAKATTPDGLKYTTQCKIGSTRDVVWARSNWAYDPRHNFNADAIAERLMFEPGTVSNRVSDFERTMVPRLTTIMTDVRKTDRSWFDSHIDKAVLDFVFGTFEGGHPSMFRVQFKLRTQGQKVTIKPIRLDCPGNCPGGSVIAKLGHDKAVEDALRRNPNIWDLGFEPALRSLIQTEIEACPREVGPPVAIVRLSNRGLMWLEQGVCNQPVSPGAPIANSTLVCYEDE